jgi:general stress protein 26
VQLESIAPGDLLVKSDLEKLYSQIADIEVAMMTTRRADGHLQSRAMATQKRVLGADLWFVTLADSPKLLDLDNDPHVNLSYYKDRTREWVSVSGIASVTRDREKIHELWAPDWKAWFPKEGDDRHGTKDDPRMVLIGVDVHMAMFLEVNKPPPVVLYEVLKGMITGATPDIGETHSIRK